MSIDTDEVEEEATEQSDIEDDSSDEAETEAGPKTILKKKLMFLLFAVIIIEGYIVLSTELLVIRQTIPFLGSGTDTISIIIAAVLMPLAFGYYMGGRFKPGPTKKGGYVSIRKRLISNILISSIILLFGISYFFLDIMSNWALHNLTTNRLILAALYSGLFLAPPVYLLGQTIPLISNYFSHKKLAEITGRMLFFSTIGSFMGAVFSTLVLMGTIGVHNTVSINFILLTTLIITLSKQKLSAIVSWSCIITLAALVFNSNAMMRQLHIIENNQYNTIAVRQTDGGKTRFLFINNNPSSKYTDSGRKFGYAEFIEEQILTPIKDNQEKKEILIIGAGGFTLGHNDAENHYDYVDIDVSLKRIAETHILKNKLKKNKTFHPMPARAFLTSSSKTYDVIVLDAYLSGFSTPEHLLTQEFFTQVKDHLNQGGIIAANFVASPTFLTPFSRHIDSTIRSVFPYLTRHVVDDEYRIWNLKNPRDANIIYIYRHTNSENAKIYTDDKNTSYMDKPPHF